MNRKLLSLSLIVFGAGAAVGHQAGPPGIEKSIAVVNIDAVKAAFPLARQRATEADELRMQYNAELDRLEAEIKKKAEQIKAYEEGSRERDNAVLEAEIASTRHRGEVEKFKHWLTRTQADHLQEIGLKLREGIAEFAKQNGFQLVLRRRSKVNPRVRNQIDSNFVEDVVFAADAIDVTKQVIDFLKAPNPNPKPNGNK